MSDPVRPKVELDLAEVHDSSVGILHHLESEQTEMSLAIAALALTLGRLTSHKVPLSDLEEQKFCDFVLDLCHAYWAGGGLN